MPGMILYDGRNFLARQGTGTATYGRNLIREALEAGYKIGVACSVSKLPRQADESVVPEMLHASAARPSRMGRVLEGLQAQLSLFANLPITWAPVASSGHAVTELPIDVDLALGRWIFRRARLHFEAKGSLAVLSMSRPPDIAHFTAPLAMRVPGACNIYTMHDLVPLRLPNAIGRPADEFRKLHLEIARKADHIVTVSEASRRDVIDLLGIPEHRVTNLYQSVAAPLQVKSDVEIAVDLEKMFGLSAKGYFLYFGAIEPKKNIGRLLEAFLSSGLDLPLVIVGSAGWNNKAEIATIDNPKFQLRIRSGRRGPFLKPVSFVDQDTLISLIRGALAVTFPSLYEGFGLPVLEAMLLGTPVLTSTTSSLPEVAGDAALLVDPTDVEAIREGLVTLASDDDLRRDLSLRGLAQAQKFTPDRYRERICALYASLGFPAPSALQSLDKPSASDPFH